MIRKLLAAVRRPQTVPAEARTVALLEELLEAQDAVARLTDDLSEERHASATARRELDAARVEIGRLLIQLEAGDRAVQPFPVPRSVSLELQLTRARADALGARVHQLQEANLRAGCMHGIPVQPRVAGGQGDSLE